MGNTVDLTITVTVTDRASMEHQLDEAVAVAMTRALIELRHGILVTRHSPGSMTVGLSEAMRFGLTREHQDW
ncbi:hypothetical protein ACFRJ8_19170 [Arthrobacter sp. NPDC056886]|uniref:hypothetical protein n=1 Tax=Arthrobacter sp. NPDC056886 TaxID=3345960 RepID=UPI00366FD597